MHEHAGNARTISGGPHGTQKKSEFVWQMETVEVQNCDQTYIPSSSYYFSIYASTSKAVLKFCNQRAKDTPKTQANPWKWETKKKKNWFQSHLSTLF